MRFSNRKTKKMQPRQIQNETGKKPKPLEVIRELEIVN